jgi:hypothetical protein
MKYKLTIAAWFSHFFENAFVSRANRRIGIRIVRFWRSTQDVERCFGSGSPLTGVSDAGSLALRSHWTRRRSDALRVGSMSVAQVLGDEFIAEGSAARERIGKG